MGLFIFCIEVILPVALHIAIFIVALLLFLWYLIIKPNLTTVHCYPDFQDYKARLASFPNYWQLHRTSTAQALAKEGLFFSHPRLTGFQVSCFSCGNVDTAPVDQHCAGASDQQTTVFAHLDSCNKSASAPLLPSAPLLAL